MEETRPAVISVNFFAASLAVNDFLARLHDYRTDGNAPYAELRASLSHVAFYPEPEKAPSMLRKYIGVGARQGRGGRAIRRRVSREWAGEQRAAGSLIPHACAIRALVIAMIEAAFRTSAVSLAGRRD